MTGQLFLGGGGDPDDERHLLVAFTAALGRRPLTYWPVALDSDVVDYDSCLRWLHTVLADFGVEQISMWDGTTDQDPGKMLLDSAGLFIGGGNTYRLLDLIRRHGLVDELRAFVDRGGVIYGGSAGAAVLGRDIDTVSLIDDDEIGMLDTHAVNLAAGFSVFCHHRPEDTDYVASWVDAHDHPAMAIPERSGVIVDRETVRVAGYEPVLLVTAEGSRLLAPGEAWAPADVRP